MLKPNIIKNKSKIHTGILYIADPIFFLPSPTAPKVNSPFNFIFLNSPVEVNMHAEYVIVILLLFPYMSSA